MTIFRKELRTGAVSLVIWSAVIGGLILGLTESYTSGYIGSEYRDVAAFIVLIAVLLIRPSGLLGKPAQKKV